MTDTDQRKKLSDTDYTKIRYAYWNQSTIREISNDFGISTKYVSKLVHAEPATGYGRTDVGIYTQTCSGCQRTFTYSGISEHIGLWTVSGGEMNCYTVVPGQKGLQ